MSANLLPSAVMKKPTGKAPVPPRALRPAELTRIRGGVTAMDDWEAPVAGAAGTKVWSDDWLAPT